MDNNCLIQQQLRKELLHQKTKSYFFAAGLQRYYPVASVLVDHANYDGKSIFAARQTYAAAAGLHERTVRVHIRKLIDIGWLREVHRVRARPKHREMRRGNGYEIAPDWLREHMPEMHAQIQSPAMPAGKKGGESPPIKGGDLSAKRGANHPPKKAVPPFKEEKSCAAMITIDNDWKPSPADWAALREKGVDAKATEACLKKFREWSKYFGHSFAPEDVTPRLVRWVERELPPKLTSGFGNRTAPKRVGEDPRYSPEDRAAFDRVRNYMKVPGGFQRLSAAEQKAVRDLGESWFRDLKCPDLYPGDYADSCAVFAGKWRKHAS